MKRKIEKADFEGKSSKNTSGTTDHQKVKHKYKSPSESAFTKRYLISVEVY